jgi:hypothetical protein
MEASHASPSPEDAAALWQQGIAQFNRQEFFESHESWELIWLPAPEPDKTFLQGIIQVAAALHHFRRGNLGGARSLLRRGVKKMEGFPGHYRGLRLNELLRAARDWQDYLQRAGEAPPAFPRIWQQQRA